MKGIKDSSEISGSWINANKDVNICQEGVGGMADPYTTVSTETIITRKIKPTLA